MEIWGTCSLFHFSTSEVLSCSGVLSMTPRQVHWWLWCWTWHPGGIGPLFGKRKSFDLHNLNMVLKEKKSPMPFWWLCIPVNIPSLAVVHLFKDSDVILEHKHKVFVWSIVLYLSLKREAFVADIGAVVLISPNGAGWSRWWLWCVLKALNCDSWYEELKLSLTLKIAVDFTPQKNTWCS